MTYNWDIDSLVQGKDKVKKLYVEEQDENEKNYYKVLLKHIDDFLKNKYIFLQDEIIPIRKRFPEIIEEISEYPFYYELAMRTMDTMNRSQKEISLIEDKLDIIFGDDDKLSVLTNAKVTRDHAMSLANKFYKSFSDSLYPTFKKAYKERYSSFLFSDRVGKDFCASSTYFDVVDKYFINIAKNNYISLIYSIIHEYGHTLAHILNPKAILLCSENMFDEVAAVFPEMVAKYENIGYYDRIHSLLELYADFINYKSMAFNLAHHIPLTNLWLDYERKIDKNFFKEVKQAYDFDRKELEEEVLYASIKVDGMYITSFLVAIELFHIYKKDKEKALKLYNEIIRIPYNESILKFVNDNMKLTEHLEEETNIVVDEFSVELKKKGI